NLAARLLASADFKRVKVSLAGEGDISLTDEAVVLLRPGARIEGVQEWAALGKLRRDDNFAVPGRIVTHSSGPKNTATLKTVMDRAQAILDEVVKEIVAVKPSAGTGAQTLEAHVSDIAYDPRLQEQGWAVILDYSVTYRARVT
ncbi:MAG: hypothetical protein ACT4PO_05835, partial [Actinomycetota bacterium]